MALVGVTEAKLYLRLQTGAEDALLAILVANATGAVEAWLGRPITAAARTFTDEALDAEGRAVCALMVPVCPVGTLTSVTGASGVAVSVADLRVDASTGRIVRKDGGTFNDGPYTIVADVGLSARQDYATVVEPTLNQAILDFVSDLYQRRNPAAIREAEGGGVAVDYGTQTRGVGADNAREDSLPPRIMALLAPYRMVM